VYHGYKMLTDRNPRYLSNSTYVTEQNLSNIVFSYLCLEGSDQEALADLLMTKVYICIENLGYDTKLLGILYSRTAYSSLMAQILATFCIKSEIFEAASLALTTGVSLALSVLAFQRSGLSDCA